MFSHTELEQDVFLSHTGARRHGDTKHRFCTHLTSFLLFLHYSVRNYSALLVFFLVRIRDLWAISPDCTTAVSFFFILDVFFSKTSLDII